jgi:hypothetical protein
MVFTLQKRIVTRVHFEMESLMDMVNIPGVQVMSLLGNIKMVRKVVMECIRQLMDRDTREHG